MPGGDSGKRRDHPDAEAIGLEDEEATLRKVRIGRPEIRDGGAELARELVRSRGEPATGGGAIDRELDLEIEVHAGLLREKSRCDAAHAASVRSAAPTAAARTCPSLSDRSV